MGGYNLPGSNLKLLQNGGVQVSDGAPELLSELLALPLPQRLQAVADDVSARTDKFRKIEPHDLAEALEVPQPWNPSSGDWSFTRAVRKLSLEEYAGLSSVPEVFERLSLIKDKLPAKRFQYLDQYLSLNNAQAGFNVLTAEERALLEEAIAWQELEGAASVGMNCFARYSVVSPSGDGSLSSVKLVPNDNDDKGEEHGISDANHCIFKSGYLLIRDQGNETEAPPDQKLETDAKADGSADDQ
jgi:hypothetical protein